MKNFVCLVLLFGCVTLSPGQSSETAPGSSRESVSKGGQQPSGGIVIDVRTPEEYREGHVDGTTNVPLAELSRRIREVAPDKKAPVAVHCRSGNRSAKAKQELEKLGYTNVKDLGSLANAREEMKSRSRAR
jgi:phage shock protein E